MRFYCIADEDTVRGFLLAGVPGRAVTSAQQAVAALEMAAAQPDYGVIILTEKVAAGIRELLDRMQFERDRPLIVEIPGPEGPLPGRKSLRQLAQEAVGIHLDQGEGT